ncbi:protein UL84 [Human betaherpesvirus 5]|nr:protein UL84 [Human betaherpesvirus 5]
MPRVDPNLRNRARRPRARRGGGGGVGSNSSRHSGKCRRQRRALSAPPLTFLATTTTTTMMGVASTDDDSLLLKTPDELDKHSGSPQTILTLTDKHDIRQPRVHRGTYHLIQLHLDLRPEELRDPFQILLSTPLQLGEANGESQTAPATSQEEETAASHEPEKKKEKEEKKEEDEDDRNDDRERGILCVVSNEDSDVRPAFSLFPARPGCHILRSVIDQQLTRMAIVRLSLNLFALRIITPLLKRLPLRRKAAHHTALHDCLALHLPELTFEPTLDINNVTENAASAADAAESTDADLTPTLTVRVRHALCWHRVEGGISGPRGLTSRISARLSETTAKTLGPSVFGRLELDPNESPPDLTLSSLTLYQDGILRFNVTCDRTEAPADPVAFRLRLRRETVRRPFFSDAPLPYFVPPRSDAADEGLEVRVPYELTLKNSHTLRIYRRFYGPYLGVFVPHNRQGLKMPVTVWLPRSWLELTVLVSDENGATFPRDALLGRLYFISSKHTLNRGCLSAMTHQVKSTLHSRSTSHSPSQQQLSVLGASIALEDLLPMRLASPETEPQDCKLMENTTDKTSPVTLAMVCGDL